MPVETAKRPARINIVDNVPWMRIGMGNQAAYVNGYRHGYEGYNTFNVCCLTKGTDERNEWMRGYMEGAEDNGGD